MRSLSEALRWEQNAVAGVAGVPFGAPPHKVLLRGERAPSRSLHRRFSFDRPAPFGLEIALTLAILMGAASLGVARGGYINEFAARYGGAGDLIARSLGLGVDIVTVSGAAHMSESRILSIAGIRPTSSLPFFDVADARARLESDPLVKQARVRKLYPNQVVVEIVERTPYAMWQLDGRVHAIAADGAPIDEVRDNRYGDLPFVVGEGANERVREFTGILDAIAELRPRVEAGVLVGQRRWSLKLKSGIEVKLPEKDPEDAVAALLTLERRSRVLERDTLALDFRTPGKVFVRLSEEAAATRSEAHSKKGAQP